MWYKRVEATRSWFDVTFSGRAAKAWFSRGLRSDGQFLEYEASFRGLPQTLRDRTRRNESPSLKSMAELVFESPHPREISLESGPRKRGGERETWRSGRRKRERLTASEGAKMVWLPDWRRGRRVAAFAVASEAKVVKLDRGRKQQEFPHINKTFLLDARYRG